ncbi:MAG TPA: thioredoxin domain-containing protein [Gaiellaceae bacterium]|nr:thioredoxin domain-containing protein [Gaiellaceae bacterium]
MASGKASKRRRAAQQALPHAPVLRGTPMLADRRVWIAAATAAAIALAVVIGIVSTRGGGGDVPPGSTLPEAAEATALFRDISQQGVALGRVGAPVTLVEFIDMQCPFCREFEVDVLPTLIEKHVRSGKVRIEIRGLTFLGPDSERGMRAVLAAGRQNRLFEVMELLFFNQGPENSGWLSQDLVEAAARSIPGLDAARLVADMETGEVSDLIAEHADDAKRRGVNSTPTILVGKTGGELTRVDLASPSDIAGVERAIAAALNA